MLGKGTHPEMLHQTQLAGIGVANEHQFDEEVVALLEVQPEGQAWGVAVLQPPEFHRARPGPVGNMLSPTPHLTAPSLPPGLLGKSPYHLLWPGHNE